MELKAFYKVENGQAQVGQGTKIPNGFIEFIVGKEPSELLESLIGEKELERVKIINQKARAIIHSIYPLEKQSSAQLGIYGDEYLATMKVFIKQVIDISNKAIYDKTPADEVDWEELDK